MFFNLTSVTSKSLFVSFSSIYIITSMHYTAHNIPAVLNLHPHFNLLIAFLNIVIIYSIFKVNYFQLFEWFNFIQNLTINIFFRNSLNVQAIYSLISWIFMFRIKVCTNLFCNICPAFLFIFVT